MAKNIKITQTRSTIRCNPTQRATMVALGLHKIRHSVTHPDTKSIQGMLTVVAHLVKVEAVS